MSGTEAFCVEGMIVTVRQPGLFDVELANGHRLLGYVTRRERERLAGAAVGHRVRVELSPCDLSKGRVRVLESER